MPIYEYICESCNRRSEALREIKNRRRAPRCSCGAKCVITISAPAVNAWKDDRRFPNVRKTGDGTLAFPSKKAYEEHLRKSNMVEVGVQAPIKKPHGNKVIATIP